MPGKAEQAFRDIANELWAYFQIGACYGGLPLPLETDPDDAKKAKKLDLIKSTFGTENDPDDGKKKKLGELIVQRMANWANLRDVSNVCAFQCGKYAADAAITKKLDVIDDVSYHDGFSKTEKEMKEKMKRCRQLREIRKLPDYEIAGGSC